MTTWNAPATTRGFSLVEALVALSLLIVLAVIALPSLVPIVDDAVVKNAARRLRTTVLETRTRAISEISCAAIRIDPSGDGLVAHVHGSPRSCAVSEMTKDATTWNFPNASLSGVRGEGDTGPLGIDSRGRKVGKPWRMVLRRGTARRAVVVDESGLVCITSADDERGCADGAS